MRAASLRSLALVGLVVAACSRAASPPPEETPPPAVTLPPTGSSSSDRASVPAESSTIANANAGAGASPVASGLPQESTAAPPGELPLICEAYFAKFVQCLDAQMAGQPEGTRAELRKRFTEATEASRRQMRVAMTPKDAQAYCEQALLALTTSSCEPPTFGRPPPPSR